MAASTCALFSNSCCAFPSTTPFSSSPIKLILPSQSNFSSRFLVCKSHNNTPICLPIKDNGFSNSLSKLHQPILAQSSNTKRDFFLRASSPDPSQYFSSQTINGAEHQDALGDSENEAGHSLKSVLQVYKGAILDGDEQIVYEIEAMIYNVEKEKSQLVQKVSSLSDEINSGKEKLIRLQADFDNFRKRSEKERLTVRSDAQGEVIESLLPMVDNFERAKQQLKLETEKEKKIDASYQGIYKQFVEILRSLQVASVPTIGKPFDPSVHEAIAREESQEFKEGIVTQEFRRGFLLGNRLLRPAMVKVSSGPGKKKQAPGTDKPSEEAATAGGVDER